MLNVVDLPSPNHEERAAGTPVDILLLHYTGMESGEAAIERLRDAVNPPRVSSHYVVRENGEILRLVEEEHRAFHAGVSSWAGATDINSRSIGIEIVNGGHDFGCPPYPAAQMQAVIALSQDILARWPAIRPARVIGHSDVAPLRKQDPGEWFDWKALAAAGVGLWVEPAALRAGPVLREGDQGAAVEAIQAGLARYGYGIKVDAVFGEETKAVVTAFQRHFRPAQVDGEADMSTRETLVRLLSAADPR